MHFKWQDQHMPLFLEAYERYECLWNAMCDDYSKTTVREKAYSSMLQDLDLPGLTTADIKAKIKTIRTRYVAELTKVRKSEKSGADPGNLYEPRLFWFKDADTFLRAVCTSKPSSSNLKKLVFKKSMENSSDNETNAPSLDADDTLDDGNHQPNNGMRNIEDSAATSSSTLGRRVPSFTKSRKRTLNNTPVPMMQDAIKKLKQISDKNKQASLNEFDAFCVSLAIQLKKMPLHRALICQENLQKVMTQERLSQIETGTAYRS